MQPLSSKALCLMLFLAVLTISAGMAQSYYTPKQLVSEFETLARGNAGKAKMHQIAVSPGGHPVIVLEIGTEVNRNEKLKPAIFVAANPEGTNPLSSYAAVKLAKQLVGNDQHLNHTWYILPVLNPDALARYFHKVKWENPRNDMKVNDDMDDAVDEDGPNDLNRDGFITDMRVRDPQAVWIVDQGEPRLMRRADRTKGERGVFTLYLEGTDDDGDGQYNEDPPGGVNTGVNFPHLFKPFTPTGGMWPGSTPEVYGTMRFIFDRPEIAATFTFGSTNFALVPPEGGRRGQADFDNITIPDEMAEAFGVDKSKKYTMDEIIELLQPMVPPGVELTPAMVASFLGLGGVVNPLPEDLAWYKELSEQYLEYLKKANFSTDRLEPEKAKDGSFELWSYYHLGVPTFSFNFFTLPKAKDEKAESSGITIDQLENMTSEEFIELGEDKINAFLKENKAPEQFKAQQVIGMLRSGQTTPRQMAAMMKSMPRPPKPSEVDPKLKALLAYSDNVLGGKGYVNWQPYQHPTLGAVEIGGPVPYVFTTPPAEAADSLIDVQLPWVFTLVEKLPKLAISDYKVKSLGADVYQLEIWVENTNYLPFPTAMGKRNNQPAPAVLLLESDGLEILQGLSRTPIRSVDGLSFVKLSFVIRMTKGKTIRARLESKSVGHDSKEIRL
ncbi:MAG: hypothetical protein K0B09_05895 [Bacteroidales bacterium]|nr:hypothetical protein [Bacteroidales bacterium]